MSVSDEGGGAFLNVTRSAKGQRWEARLRDQRLAHTIAEKNDLPEILGRVMAARGVQPDEVEAYLNPTIRGLMPSPSALMDMQKGASRLADAIIAKEKIGVISDYDVDGVTSAAILLRFLRAVGHDAITYLPDRLTEGYGPSEKAVTSLKEQGAQLLMTLDCGVLSHDPLAHAAELGLTTIIVDHHQAGVELPEAYAVINPNRQDDMSGQGHLCACGIVFLVVANTNKILRERRYYAETQEPNLLQWLDLVALGTVADVVPLKGLNRAYVTQGLKVMARRDNLGIAALCDVGGVKRRPDAYALGFVLGPRINAAGRVGHADEALALLTTMDKGNAAGLAHHLNEMNRHRQAVELRVVDEAVSQAEAALGTERQASTLIVAAETWHPGVVGLAASRLKDRYGVPSLVLAINKATALATGSGRSISGVDLGKAVRAALEAGHIVKGGGHAMAAGLTMEIGKLAGLRQFMEEFLAGAVSANRTQSLLVDGALSASGATLDLIELLEQAGPYGAANPSPIFVFPAHRVTYADRAGTDHVRCTLVASDGSKLKAIAFRALGTELGELLLSERQHPIHVAGRLVTDEWGAKRVPSLQIDDAALMA